MSCYYCGGETADFNATSRLERDGLKVIVTNIPSQRCGRCKAIYYYGDVAFRLLDAADLLEKIPASKRPDLISFQKLPRKRLKRLKFKKKKKDKANQYRIIEL